MKRKMLLMASAVAFVGVSAVIVFIHGANPIYTNYDSLSPRYTIYYILKCISPFVVISTCYCLGDLAISLVDRYKYQIDKFELMLAKPIIGAGLLNCVWICFGWMKMFDFTSAFAFFILVHGAWFVLRNANTDTTPSLFRTQPVWSVVLSAVFVVLICTIAADLMIRNANIPALTNDGDTTTNYMPYYAQSIEVYHSFTINNFLPIYYALKGSGVQAYLMSMTDYTFASSVSFAYILLLSCVIFIQLKKLGTPVPLALFGIVMFLMSRLCKATNYYKIHISAAYFFVGYVYIMSLYNVAGKRLRLLSLAYQAGGLLCQPFLAAFYLPVSLCQLYLTKKTSAGSKFDVYAPTVATILLPIVFLSIEYIRYGLPEYQLSFFWTHLADSRLGQSVSPACVILSHCLQVATTQPITEYVSFTNSLIQTATDVLFFSGNTTVSFSVYLLVLALSVFVLPFIARKNHFLLMSSVSLVIIFGVCVVYKHPSFDRITVFRSFFMVFMLVAAVNVFTALSKNKQIVQVLYFVVLSATSSLYIYNNIGCNDWGFYLGFLFNGKPYVKYFNHNFDTVTYADLQKKYLGDSFCVHLNQWTPLSGFPGSQFITNDQVSNPIAGDFVALRDEALYNALVASHALFVSFDTGYDFSCLVNSDFFSKEFMEKYTTLVYHEKSIWLFKIQDNARCNAVGREYAFTFPMGKIAKSQSQCVVTSLANE